MTGLFVTGTDTGCGKTAVSLGIMAALQARGLRVMGMKPVATGCLPTAEGPRNDDAMRLRAQCSDPTPYDTLNPYALAPPIAPHIAAREAGIQISGAEIRSAYARLQASADLVVVEGVGGWRVPLGPGFSVSDLPLLLGLPVILVVGLKLGGINHALLTAESIRASGTRLAGWVANQIEPEMPARDANLATLAETIEAPCLGLVPRLDRLEPSVIAGFLRLEPIAGLRGAPRPS